MSMDESTESPATLVTRHLSTTWGTTPASKVTAGPSSGGLRVPPVIDQR